MIPTLATRFGFLSEPFSMSVATVRIEPLPDYGERRAWYKANAHADGFFYPPQIAHYKRTYDGARGRKLPHTTRPAGVYKLPASHAIEISAPIEQNQPYSDANFLIQILGFIFGTRLQFEEWRLDGRVPTKSVLNVSIENATRAHFVEHMYRWWRTLPPDHRTRVGWPGDVNQCRVDAVRLPDFGGQSRCGSISSRRLASTSLNHPGLTSFLTRAASTISLMRFIQAVRTSVAGVDDLLPGHHRLGNERTVRSARCCFGAEAADARTDHDSGRTCAIGTHTVSPLAPISSS